MIVNMNEIAAEIGGRRNRRRLPGTYDWFGSIIRRDKKSGI